MTYVRVETIDTFEKSNLELATSIGAALAKHEPTDPSVKLVATSFVFHPDYSHGRMIMIFERDEYPQENEHALAATTDTPA